MKATEIWILSASSKKRGVWFINPSSGVAAVCLGNILIICCQCDLIRYKEKAIDSRLNMYIYIARGKSGQLISMLVDNVHRPVYNLALLGPTRDRESATETKPSRRSFGDRDKGEKSEVRAHNPFW